MSSAFSPLDGAVTEPFFRQIYARIRAAIASGMLKPGDRVPSVRALSKELGLAKGTIEAAYALLAAEGYVQMRGQAGTIVTPGLQVHLAGAAPLPPVLDSTVTSFRPDTVSPFQMGLPALDAFPRKLWARMGAHVLRSVQAADMVHPAVYGLPALRTEIAAYLQMARGIHCRPQQVFVTSGYRSTLALIAHALLRPGDQVWLENPGYPPTRELLGYLGMAGVAVPVDGDGLMVDAGLRAAPAARAAVVTPGHQSPLGVSLSLPRRLALLDWAERQKAWIIEDDYDGEYRYVSRPLPSLKSLDRGDRVLYAGTFSKVLLPNLRLAYLIVPEMQVERFAQVLQIFAAGNPAFTQAVVANFMQAGHFARHIQRMRKLYAERRSVVVAALESVLGSRASIAVQPGGMHLIVRLHSAQSERRLVARIRADGLYAEAMSDWMMTGSAEPAILLGFTNIASQAEATALGQRLLRLIMT